MLTLTNSKKFIDDQHLGFVRDQSEIGWFELPSIYNTKVRNISVKETRVIRESSPVMELPGGLTRSEESFLSL